MTLVQEYAAACASAERHHTLAERLVDDPDGQLAARAAEYESVATVRHAQLLTALDNLTRTTVRALPDDRLPVCTWQHGLIEVRGVLPDGSRSVRALHSRAGHRRRNRADCLRRGNRQRHRRHPHPDPPAVPRPGA
jgi:hypothetical protein